MARLFQKAGSQKAIYPTLPCGYWASISILTGDWHIPYYPIKNSLFFLLCPKPLIMLEFASVTAEFYAS
jgi:hypothetical protein